MCPPFCDIPMLFVLFLSESFIFILNEYDGIFPFSDNPFDEISFIFYSPINFFTIYNACYSVMFSPVNPFLSILVICSENAPS